MKRYDAGTTLDADDRVIGHYCAGDAPCGHCERYPFAYPTAWGMVSDKTLEALERRALAEIDKATAALRSIGAERVARAREMGATA